jgi:hypothetical protein
MACNSRNCNSPALCCTNNNVAERTCIQVDRVFDACIQQRSVPSTLTVSFTETPTGVTAISVTNSGPGEVSDVEITPISGSRSSRVSYILTVPILVVATNAAGSQFTGTSTMTFVQDLILRVPQDGVISPEIVATAVVVGVQNSLSGNVLTTNACVTIITKVVANVILVVPSYGYPILPPCQEYTEDLCSGIFDTPVFPR